MKLGFIQMNWIVETEYQMRSITEDNPTDEEILKRMANRMADIQRLLNTSTEREKLVGYIQEKYPACYRYIKILEIFDEKIKNELIELPPE